MILSMMFRIIIKLCCFEQNQNCARSLAVGKGRIDRTKSGVHDLYACLAGYAISACVLIL